MLGTHLVSGSLFILITLCGPVLKSQTTFEKCVGWIDDDFACAATDTPDRGFLICGTTMDSNTLNPDGVILCLDSAGNLLWTSRYGKPYPGETPESVAVTRDFQVVSAGNEGSFGTFGKWTASGTNLWRDTVTTVQAFTSVASTHDSGFVFGGNSYYKAAVFKTDSSGAIQWSNTAGGPSYQNHTSCHSIIQNWSGGYTLCGSKALSPYPGTAAFFALIHPNGSIQLQKTIGDQEHTEIAMQIKQMPDHGYAYCGFHSNSYMVPPIGDGILVRTNSGGDALWSKTYGGQKNDQFNSMDTVPEGGFILCGFTENYGAGQTDLWLVRTTATGDTLWTRTFGGSYDDVGVSVITLADGGFFIAGYSNSFHTYGYDIYIIRTDENGLVERSEGGVEVINPDQR